MAEKKWKIAVSDKEQAKYLAEECGIDPFTALIACGRGFTEPDEIEQLISNELFFCDPFELIDMQKAADCINEAIAKGDTIAIFGDYDCDGVVATAIMYKYLSCRGVTGLTYIPDRLAEGYGMNMAAIDYLHSEGVKLIITVDNGIACAKEIEYAKTLGIKTVVTDHHLPPETLPDAEAVVDPHRTDCPSTFKEVCGAMLAFKLVCALSGKEPEQIIYKYADLLAVATVGDVMPLTYENRSVVKAGLLKLKHDPNSGLAAIMVVAAINRGFVTSSKIAFGIVPRINVAGRMGSALRALKLLCASDISEALSIANEIDEDNTRRREAELQYTLEMDEAIRKSKYNHDRVIVIEDEEIHPGIVGIIASRFVEKYGKPTFVLRSEGGMCHGSGRSVKGLHLYDALCSCSDILDNFGGHELAAGVSVSTDKLDEFRKRINEYSVAFPPVHAELSIDLRLNPAALSTDLVAALKPLEPFGPGNPTPVFAITQICIKRMAALKNGKHMKLIFSKGEISFEAIYFGVYANEFYYEVGDIVDIAVTLEINHYNNEDSLSVQIKAIRRSDVDEEQLFADIDNYDAFVTGGSYAADTIFPSRAEVGAVYKCIAKGYITAAKLEHIFLRELGSAKTKVAIKTLSELRLIRGDGITFSVNKDAPKTDLSNSDTYKKLLNEVSNT